MHRHQSSTVQKIFFGKQKAVNPLFYDPLTPDERKLLSETKKQFLNKRGWVDTGCNWVCRK